MLNNKEWIWIGATIAVVVAVVVVIVRSQLSAAPNIDDDDLCPDKRHLTGQIAIVLDPSDSLHYTQRAAARDRILHFMESVPQYTDIKLYALLENERERSNVEFRVCVPGDPDDTNPWIENPEIERRRYKEKFRDPLDQHLEELLGGSGALASPILKTIQDVAVDAFPPTDPPLPRQLILVSDMVQHSSDMSFFEGSLDFLDLINNPNYPTMQVDLEGVEVTIFFLRRRGLAGRIQARPIQEFWDEYFLDQGARQPSWNRVTG